VLLAQQGIKANQQNPVSELCVFCEYICVGYSHSSLLIFYIALCLVGWQHIAYLGFRSWFHKNSGDASGVPGYRREFAEQGINAL